MAIMFITCTEIKSRSSQEILVSKPVVVPDCQLQTSVCDVLNGEVIPANGLLPPRAGGSSANSCLLLAPTWLTWQQVAGNEFMKNSPNLANSIYLLCIFSIKTFAVHVQNFIRIIRSIFITAINWSWSFVNRGLTMKTEPEESACFPVLKFWKLFC